LAELAANYNNNFAALIASKRLGAIAAAASRMDSPIMLSPFARSEGSRQSSPASTPWLKSKMEMEMERLAWPGPDNRLLTHGWAN